MTVKVVNFELLYIDGDQSAETLADKNFQLIMNELSETDADHIIGLLLLDGFLYKDNELFYKTMRMVQEHANKIGIQKITLLAGMCENFEQKLKDNGVYFDVEFFDFTQWMISRSYDSSLENTEWNHTDRFLFLGGIPSRTNRINLLYKFYTQGMLPTAEWSFFPPWTEDDKTWCRAALHNLTDKEYNAFLDYCNKGIDELYSDAKNYSKLNGTQLKQQNIYDKEWLKDPGYIDPSIYNKTCFSVIAEGNAYPPATDFNFLTEKTWRAVANCHPFIIAGYSEQVEYAQRRGLKTFNEYFLIKDYHLIDDENTRLDAIVKNTAYFLDTYTKHASSILADIKHNYNVFKECTQLSKNQISKYTLDDQDSYFYKKGFSHLVRIADGN